MRPFHNANLTNDDAISVTLAFSPLQCSTARGAEFNGSCYSKFKLLNGMFLAKEKFLARGCDMAFIMPDRGHSYALPDETL